MPSSMPMSVTMPVTWVVRISAFDSALMTAFCQPMINASRITVTETTRPSTTLRRAPSRPKHSSRPASSIRGSAYSLCMARWRE